jgi:uncharacterized SAM-binding protein YcdF (DUF218 family)
MLHRKVFAGRSGGRHLPRRLWFLATLCAVAWLAGLLWFASNLPSSIADGTRATDAIVVLTGGKGRVHQGLELLSQQRAKKLFISGVYRGVDVEELLRMSRQSPENLACCISLGYEADNTRGNAVESAVWMREQGLQSLRLVTSAYHMPRSLLEFRQAMPEIEILPHPVFSNRGQQNGWQRWPGRIGLVVSEYSKYLIALLWARIAGAA